MSLKPRKPYGFLLLCCLYVVLTVFGYILFGESHWVRQIKGSGLWSSTFASFEDWIKGSDRGDSPELTGTSLVMIGEIKGPDALLVRDFSSLVFRSAHENDFLKGRNVLLTKDGVEARLWLVDYDSWLEMQPNTLIVLDQVRSASGDSSVLNLSVLAGSWNLKQVKESEVEAISSPAMRESVKARRESRKVASQDRNPSSTSDSSASDRKPVLPGIQIQDFVKMREYEAVDPGVVAEVKEILPVVSARSAESEKGVSSEGAEDLVVPTPAFWGESASIEGSGFGSSLGTELKTLAKVLESSEPISMEPEPFIAEPVKEAELVQVSQASKSSAQPQRLGSLKGLDKVFAAETNYISSAIQAGDSNRSPAASAIGLSVALERAASMGSSQDFNPAMAQVLNDYLQLYLARNECGMVQEIHENVENNFVSNEMRLEWQRNWAQSVEKSSCRKLLQADNKSQLQPKMLSETHYIQRSLNTKREPASDLGTLQSELDRAGDARLGSAFNEALAQVLEAQIDQSLRAGDCQRAAEIVNNVQKSYEENTILLNWISTWSKKLANQSCID